MKKPVLYGKPLPQRGRNANGDGPAQQRLRIDDSCLAAIGTAKGPATREEVLAVDASTGRALAAATDVAILVQDTVAARVCSGTSKTAFMWIVLPHRAVTVAF